MRTVDKRDDNSYQLTLVPLDFYFKHGAQSVATCIYDNEELEHLDRFEESTTQGIRNGFYFEGDFKMCPVCAQAHYIVDTTHHLLGPVTVQWSN